MIPDNYSAYEAHERNQAAAVARRKICDCCGEPIFSESAFRIGDELWCEDCMEDCRTYDVEIEEDWE